MSNSFINPTSILIDKEKLRTLVTNDCGSFRKVSIRAKLNPSYINHLINGANNKYMKKGDAESVAKALGTTVKEFTLKQLKVEHVKIVKPVYEYNPVEIVKFHKKKEVDFKHWVSLPKREVDSSCVYEVDRLGTRRMVARTNGNGVVIYLNEYVAHNALETLVQGIRNRNVE